jgi:hypothetical protein
LSNGWGSCKKLQRRQAQHEMQLLPGSAAAARAL